MFFKKIKESEGEVEAREVSRGSLDSLDSVEGLAAGSSPMLREQMFREVMVYR